MYKYLYSKMFCTNNFLLYSTKVKVFAAVEVSHYGSTSGGHFGQNCKKLHENYEINIFEAK